MWLWLIALLMCTLEWSSSLELQCHKKFHLKPKAAINYTEISPLICHWYQYNGGKCDWRLSSRLILSNLCSFVHQWNSLESTFSLILMGTLITPWHGAHDIRWSRSQLVPIEFKSDPSYVKHTIRIAEISRKMHNTTTSRPPVLCILQI